jgi:hypothetical protein
MKRSLVKPLSKLVSILALLGPMAMSSEALDPSLKCESGKLKESAKYAACRLKAESKAVRIGGSPDFSRCQQKFPSKFNQIEANVGPGVCPSENDGASIDARITGDADDLAILLAGGTLADCDADLATCTTDLATCDADLLTCDGDLTTCESDLAACEVLPAAQTVKTGQTNCYDGSGPAIIPCAGTGQDGELQRGLARSFIDNGDGTITAETTGLMWEKHSRDGSIHDMNTGYSWTNAFAKIASLNGAAFAGYTDWRLPNISELHTLVNYSAEPFVDAAFSTACAPGCDVLSCSCTASLRYWSSTTGVTLPGHAYYVQFSSNGGSSPPGGHISSTAKGAPGGGAVRAVRGGP